ncbi:MAG: DUF2207 domain-containing protein [Notoacmeibacter sp.]|nr:DUF2207 domain-containing protein [Notoacmeibacter sp.]
MAVLFIALVLLAALVPARAAEVIHGFHSAIEIAGDGELTVTETIAVRAEGREIRRGIYRDFPLIVEDADGRRHEVGFDVTDVRRDGRPENYRIEKGSGIARVYIGDADVFLSPGDYTYQLTYRTDRQIRYFDDHDELFWNVTGNAWIFPIQSASAEITLPAGAAIGDTVYFTGYFGARDKNAYAELSADRNTARFATTAPLAANEGLTVGVSFAKGIIAAPDQSQLTRWWLRDNLGALIAAFGVVAVFAYYLWAWRRVGRDPPRGVVVPRWDAPDGISPALTNYIDRKGFSGQGWEAISAALINLAVKGFVKLEDLAGDVTIVATGKQGIESLPTGEKSLMTKIASRENGLKISKSNGSTVSSMHSGFTTAMEREHRNAFFRRNTGYVVGGVALSVICLALILVVGQPAGEALAAIIPLVFVSIFGTVVAGIFGRQRARGLAGKIQAVFFVAVASFVLFSSGGAVLAAILSDADPVLVVSVIGLFVLNALFYFLLGAPTPIGARMMDGIDGLKTYIRLAEKDRMNLAGVPAMSPQHFETVLPYAVALGLENPWTKAFEAWLAAAAVAGAAAAAYSPSWYYGRSFDPGDFSRSISGITSGLADSLAASMPAPKSSSSGFSGGGSSGGGGGGGGGGGW